MDLSAVDDFIREMKNKLWRRGGCEAVEDADAMGHTCQSCGHKHQRPLALNGCDVCGKTALDTIAERLQDKLDEE